MVIMILTNKIKIKINKRNINYFISKGYDVKLFSNKFLWASVILSLGLQAVIMYTPLKKIFGIIALSLSELKVLFIAGLVFVMFSFIYIKTLNKYLENHLA